MVFAAIAIVVALDLLVTVYVMDRAARARNREHAREKMSWSAERADLLNRIMYMAKMPWSGPVPEVEEERPNPYDDFAFPHEIVGVTEDELIS